MRREGGLQQLIQGLFPSGATNLLVVAGLQPGRCEPSSFSGVKLGKNLPCNFLNLLLTWNLPTNIPTRIPRDVRAQM